MSLETRSSASLFAHWRSFNSTQRHTLVACLLGWTLDAFDYFLLIFAVKSIAHDFHAKVGAVMLATTVTLALRPVGALIFGWAADRYGRRPVLMINVISYSILELASAASPSLPVLLVLRGLYGIAMGGEWGVGAALALESLPSQSRGTVSGLLQQGYALGYLLASVVFGLFFTSLGWRGMFVVGALPALLVLYIRTKVPESPGWKRKSAAGGVLRKAIAANKGRFAYLVGLMAVFNCFSHGTQDLYPTFLQLQRGLDSRAASEVAVVYSIGALLGGIIFGTLSERIGRRYAIAVAALLALPAIPLWVLAHHVLTLALGAFVLQFMVQGAWGIVPAHLNELSPPGVRATFPGFAYQLGNFLASGIATVETWTAPGGNYAWSLGLTTVVVAVLLTALALLGPEAKGATLGSAQGQAKA